LADKQEHSLRDAIEKLADTFNLSENERKKFLPSGLQPVFANRVGWARTYMKKAGLIESTKRGSFKITKRGIEALKENPPEINVKILEKYPEFIKFRETRREKEEGVLPETETNIKQSPEDLLVSGEVVLLFQTAILHLR
jgi:restriction system protein